MDDLIATELELEDDLFTGKVAGIANFQAGKVRNLELWLAQHEGELSMENSVFYSDSFNDLPLLEIATRAVAVDPDDTLRKIAQERNWEILSLR